MTSLRVWPLLLGTGALFGVGLPLAQLGSQQGVDLMAFAVWTTATAAAGLAALGWIRHGPLRIQRRLIRFGLLAGTFGHALPASAGYWLVRETGAGFAALAYTMPPALTLVLSLMLRLEQPGRQRVIAVGTGLGGALLLVAGRGAALAVGPTAIAALLVIPVSIAAGNVYRALHLPKAVPPEWLAALMLASSAGLFAVSGALQGRLEIPLRTSALLWPALQALAMFVAYLLFFALQRRAEPVTTSFVGYVSMMTATAIGAIAFGDRVPTTVWPALALIGGSIWLLRRSGPAPTAAADAACSSGGTACANDHCSLGSDRPMPFDCSESGFLPCA